MKPDGLDSKGVIWQEEYIPYDWLFEHCAAVIHHGVAGTTGKALRAGIPNIILPFTSDQPFWGRRVHQLGAGPKPLAPNRLTSSRLARAINTVLNDKTMKNKAKQIGSGLQNEDGVDRAIRRINGILNLEQAR